VVVVSAVAQLPQRLLTVIDGYVQKGQDPDVLLGTVSRILKFPEQRGRANGKLELRSQDRSVC